MMTLHDLISLTRKSLLFIGLVAQVRCLYDLTFTETGSNKYTDPRDHEIRQAWLGSSFPLDLSTLPLRSEEIPLQYPSLSTYFLVLSCNTACKTLIMSS